MVFTSCSYGVHAREGAPLLRLRLHLIDSALLRSGCRPPPRGQADILLAVTHRDVCAVQLTVAEVEDEDERVPSYHVHIVLL